MWRRRLFDAGWAKGRIGDEAWRFVAAGRMRLASLSI
jgi:hypothetical protein